MNLVSKLCYRLMSQPLWSTCRWGHAASKVGSSSSGSNSAPVGLEDGGNVRNILTANWNYMCL